METNYNIGDINTKFLTLNNLQKILLIQVSQDDAVRPKVVALEF